MHIKSKIYTCATVISVAKLLVNEWVGKNTLNLFVEKFNPACFFAYKIVNYGP